MKNYWVLLSILTIVSLAVVVFTANALEQSLHWTVYAILGYFVVLTSVLHIMLESASKKRAQQFVNTFMGVTGAKMFLSMMILFIAAYVFRDNAVQIAMGSLFFYVLFTGFEVTIMLKMLKKQKEEELS